MSEYIFWSFFRCFHQNCGRREEADASQILPTWHKPLEECRNGHKWIYELDVRRKFFSNISEYFFKEWSFFAKFVQFGDFSIFLLFNRLHLLVLGIQSKLWERNVHRKSCHSKRIQRNVQSHVDYSYMAIQNQFTCTEWKCHQYTDLHLSRSTGGNVN